MNAWITRHRHRPLFGSELSTTSEPSLSVHVAAPGLGCGLRGGIFIRSMPTLSCSAGTRSCGMWALSPWTRGRAWYPRVGKHGPPGKSQAPRPRCSMHLERSPDAYTARSPQLQCHLLSKSPLRPPSGSSSFKALATGCSLSHAHLPICRLIFPQDCQAL